MSLLFGTLGAIVASYLIFYYSADLPDYNQLAKYHPALASRIYTYDGKLIEQFARENRVFVNINSVPKNLINAFISAEDKHFYSHQGVDIIGIIRAAISNVSNILSHKRLEGASTITQQVVKNLLLTNERSIARKVKEAVLSYMISKTFTKDQILELYLNQTFFGKGAYGVASAAQTYFNKSVEELTLEEAAFIAGLPKAPSSFDPARNYEKSKERRDYVIHRMLEDQNITPEEAKSAFATPITLKSRDKKDLVNAPYFAELIRSLVSDMVGEEEFYTGGYTVITTLDSELQRDLSSSLVEGIRKYDQWKGYKKPLAKISINDWQKSLNEIQEQASQREYSLAVVLSITDTVANIGLKDGSKSTIPLSEAKWARTNVKSFKTFLNVGDVIAVEPVGKEYGLRQIPEVNGGSVISDPSTGAVRAYVGGYDYGANKYDRVTQALRQPGSTIKTFIYLAAIEQGVKPNSIFNDEPVALYQGPGLPLWKPKNFKGDFLGPITLRTALEKSRNLVTVRIGKLIGINKVVEIVSRLGINTSPPNYFSIVLGALETNLTRMVSAYSTIANGGYEVLPHYIELIQDKNGKIIYRRNDQICHNCENYNQDDIIFPEVETTAKKRLIDPVHAYQITSILKGAVVRGTSSTLAKYKLPLAAKTGTTNSSKDTWHIAFTREMVIGTYIGYDTPRDMGKSATGFTVALPVTDILLSKISSRMSKLDFSVPEGATLVSVDKNTGIPSNGPGTILEVFKAADNNNVNPVNFEDNDENTTLNESDWDIFSNDLPPEKKNEFLENTGEVY